MTIERHQAGPEAQAALDIAVDHSLNTLGNDVSVPGPVLAFSWEEGQLREDGRGDGILLNQIRVGLNP